MSGASAAKTLLQIKVASLKAQGKEITKEEEDKLLKEITDKYNEQLSPYYAASRLWVDGVIDPLQTRQLVSAGIEAANHAPVEKFNVGVIQT
jgi:acetyl-CoA carboxylase carboxyltransferase component